MTNEITTCEVRQALKAHLNPNAHTHMFVSACIGRATQNPSAIRSLVSAALAAMDHGSPTSIYLNAGAAGVEVKTSQRSYSFYYADAQ